MGARGGPTSKLLNRRGPRHCSGCAEMKLTGVQMHAGQSVTRHP